MKKAVDSGKRYTRQHEDNIGEETKRLQDILEHKKNIGSYFST